MTTDNSRLIFGGNVFGWTVDQKSSFDLLDHFLDGGFNSIDTANVYSAWAPGNRGGESETIIGHWLRERGNRSDIFITTKVGAPTKEEGKGLSAAHIKAQIDKSLRRLQTDYVDSYLVHYDDEDTPIEETLLTLDELIKVGKVRAIGVSNMTAGRLRMSLDKSAQLGVARYQVLQPLYNLYDRSTFEGDLENLCKETKLRVTPYYALASGFLSGKYRSNDDLSKSVRGGGKVKSYMTDKGMRTLDAIDRVAARHGAKPSQIAIAWLLARPAVSAPIVSATNKSQLDELMGAARLTLASEDIRILEQTT